MTRIIIEIYIIGGVIMFFAAVFELCNWSLAEIIWWPVASLIRTLRGK